MVLIVRGAGQQGTYPEGHIRSWAGPSPTYRRPYRTAVGILSAPGRFGVLAFVSFEASCKVVKTTGASSPTPGPAAPNEPLK